MFSKEELKEKYQNIIEKAKEVKEKVEECIEFGKEIIGAIKDMPAPPRDRKEDCFGNRY